MVSLCQDEWSHCVADVSSEEDELVVCARCHEDLERIFAEGCNECSSLDVFHSACLYKHHRRGKLSHSSHILPDQLYTPNEDACLIYWTFVDDVDDDPTSQSSDLLLVPLRLISAEQKQLLTAWNEEKDTSFYQSDDDSSTCQPPVRRNDETDEGLARRKAEYDTKMHRARLANTIIDLAMRFGVAIRPQALVGLQNIKLAVELMTY